MLLVLCGLSLLAPIPEKGGDLRPKFEAWSRELTFFPRSDFIYDRPFHIQGMDRDKLQAWARCRADLRAARDRLPELIELLDHLDPRVRTLALAALFDREDPTVLPNLARLMGDLSISFPEAVYNSGSGTVEFREQTVAQTAHGMVTFWVISTHHPSTDFAAYWQEGKGCPSRSAWFEARLSRAEGGITPFQKERADRVRAVRQAVDNLPLPARDWTLLWLASYRPPDKRAAFAKEEELFAAAKRLGPELLLRLVQGREVCADPELTADAIRLPRRAHLVGWVLGHARFFLAAEDASIVLAAEKVFPTPACAIAAAELQPKNAATWLRQAQTRFTSGDQGKLAAALWRICGEAEIDHLVKWFYSVKVPEMSRSEGQYLFLEQVAGAHTSANRRLLGRLISDPRLESLEERSLLELALAVNRSAKTPVLSTQDLYLREPSEKVESRLARWRAALRKGVAAWK